MSMLTDLGNLNNGRALTIADYEARIEIYKEQIGTGYIGIGRTLIEAKEAGAVPHGEWEGWVTRVTGLTVRQAQRCMQAARETREGSALARLEMSKAMLLLQSGLDEDTREEIARGAGEDGTSLRALRKEIEDAQRKLAEKDEDLQARLAEKDAEAARKLAEKDKEIKLQAMRDAGTAAEIREAYKKAERERKQLESQMREMMDAYQQQVEEAAGAAYQRGLQDQTGRLKESVRAEYAEHMEEARLQRVRLGREIEALQARLDESARAMEAKEAQLREIREDLEAAEEREEKRSRQLNRMQEELSGREMDAARGVRAAGVGAVDLGDAVRRFLGVAGVLPQMGAVIGRMDARERDALRAHIDAIAKWAEEAQAALDSLAADGTVE